MYIFPGGKILLVISHFGTFFNKISAFYKFFSLIFQWFLAENFIFIKISKKYGKYFREISTKFQQNFREIFI